MQNQLHYSLAHQGLTVEEQKYKQVHDGHSQPCHMVKRKYNEQYLSDGTVQIQSGEGEYDICTITLCSS